MLALEQREPARVVGRVFRFGTHRVYARLQTSERVGRDVAVQMVQHESDGRGTRGECIHGGCHIGNQLAVGLRERGHDRGDGLAVGSHASHRSTVRTGQHLGSRESRCSILRRALRAPELARRLPGRAELPSFRGRFHVALKDALPCHTLRPERAPLSREIRSHPERGEEEPGEVR